MPSLKRLDWPSWKRTLSAAREKAPADVPSGQAASTSASVSVNLLRLPLAILVRARATRALASFTSWSRLLLLAYFGSSMVS